MLPYLGKWEGEFQLDRKRGTYLIYGWVQNKNEYWNRGMQLGHKEETNISALCGIPQSSRQKYIYAIKECNMKNINGNYKNRYIYILLDSQAALKALDSFQINSKLVWKCLQSLLILVEHNREQLILVPGHRGVAGNEVAYTLAEQAS
jgi:hypothetical protein